MLPPDGSTRAQFRGQGSSPSGWASYHVRQTAHRSEQGLASAPLGAHSVTDGGDTVLECGLQGPGAFRSSHVITKPYPIATSSSAQTNSVRLARDDPPIPDLVPIDLCLDLRHSDAHNEMIPPQG